MSSLGSLCADKSLPISKWVFVFCFEKTADDGVL
jgi:hypothetical protein